MRAIGPSLKSVCRNVLHGEFRYPLYASFKVTNLCGRRCDYCNVWRRMNPDRLSTADCCQIIGNLADSGIYAVAFEGGEPFLRKDILEIARYARQRLPNTTLCTSLERMDFPLEEASQVLDNLHISIDDEHGNTEMYERLPGIRRRISGAVATVQIVVRDCDMVDLPRKVALIARAGFKAVVMPAARLPGTPRFYPDPKRFADLVLRLKRQHPRTVITPRGFVEAIQQPHGCTPASIIVDADGSLFYPCRTTMNRTVNLVSDSLREYLNSTHAAMLRSRMHECGQRCGWYQYFATSSFAAPISHPIRCARALRPYWRHLFEPFRSVRVDTARAQA